MSNKKDIAILSELASKYKEITQDPVQAERRELWSRHFGNKDSRPPIMINFGMHNYWCQDVFNTNQMECNDPFLRQYEQALKMFLFHATLGDDFVFEPWLTVRASVKCHPDGVWGIKREKVGDEYSGQAVKYLTPLKQLEDWRKMTSIPHEIDENETQENVDKLQEAVGDHLTVNVNRAPLYIVWNSDISTLLGHLRGIENVMIDMLDNPTELHEMLSFMRDGILANHEQAEEAGDWGLTNHNTQAMPYCDELELPKPNIYNIKRKDLFMFCAAQEFTGVSPKMHDEFLLEYQRPIIEKFALTHYGCCEDLTRKIKIMRKIKNLRSIAVTPVANVRKCAEQIGSDYVASWRPNPTDMVCGKFNTENIREILSNGAKAMNENSCRYHVYLKDVETVEGEPERLKKWVDIVKSIV